MIATGAPEASLVRYLPFTALVILIRALHRFEYGTRGVSMRYTDRLGEATQPLKSLKKRWITSNALCDGDQVAIRIGDYELLYAVPLRHERHHDRHGWL